MKITLADGVVIECTVEEFNKVFGYKEEKPKFREWMVSFEDGEEDIFSAFLWSDTPEGHEWWEVKEKTTEGKARFEEMKREYAEWKATQ